MEHTNKNGCSATSADASNGFSEEITLEGHIIDSWILPKVFDTVMDLGGSFDLKEIRVGRRKDETSFARLKVMSDRAEFERALDNLLLEFTEELKRRTVRK